MTNLLSILAAYLIGSISSAIIICRLMGLPDPRTEGSRNPGATNVLRLGGRKAAAATLFGDCLKGFAPVYAANLMMLEPMTVAGVAMAAFLGHLYPIFFGFRGGKGVATALGVQFGLGWLIGGSVTLVWLAMARLVNLSSLSALVSMALAPPIVWFFLHSPELFATQAGITLLLFWRHRGNIQRLLEGSEGKIKDKQGEEDS